MANEYKRESFFKRLIASLWSIESTKGLNERNAAIKSAAMSATTEMNDAFKNDNTARAEFSKLRSAIKDSGLISGETIGHIRKALSSTVGKKAVNNGYLIALSDLTDSNAKTLTNRTQFTDALKSDLAFIVEEMENLEEKSKERAFLSDVVELANGIKFEHESLQYIKLPEFRQKRLEKIAEERVNNTLAYQQTIVNFSDVQHMSNLLLKSHNTYDLLLGLALATGRRMAEIVWSGKFVPVGENLIQFSGALKKGGSASSEATDIYSIVNAYDVCERLEFFRSGERAITAIAKCDKSNSPEPVNAVFASNCNQRAKKWLTMLNQSHVWKYSDTRAIWVRWVKEAFFENNPLWDKVSDDEFYRVQLIHSDSDYTTQHAYKRFKVRKTEPVLANHCDYVKLIEREGDILELITGHDKESELLDCHIAVRERLEFNPSQKLGLSLISGGMAKGYLSYPRPLGKAYLEILECV